MRSRWKGKFVKDFLYLKLDNKILVTFGSSIITQKFLGFRVLLHLGYKFKSFIIKKKMIGFRFGEFLRTKKGGRQIHLVKNKKEKKKK